MTSIRSQILDALVAKVNAIPSLGAKAYRGRPEPQMRHEGSIVLIEPLADTADLMVVPKADWQLTVGISVIVRGDPPDAVAEPIITAIYKKIMSDLTVSGLAYDVQPQTVQWDLVNADSNATVVSCNFLVLYRTALDDISVS